MRKKVLSAVLSLVLCMSCGGVVMAEEDNSARIAEIETQIAALKAELRELTGEVSEGDIIYEDDEVVIVYDGMSETYSGYGIDVLIENLSDQTLTVQVRETSINDFMVDPSGSIEIAAGKSAKDNFSIIGDDAEDFPMDEVESIETKFCIYRGDGFMDSYTTDAVIINIE